MNSFHLDHSANEDTDNIQAQLYPLLQYNHHSSSVCLGFSTCTMLLTALVLQFIIYSYPGDTFVRNNLETYYTINF